MYLSEICATCGCGELAHSFGFDEEPTDDMRAEADSHVREPWCPSRCELCILRYGEDPWMWCDTCDTLCEGQWVEDVPSWRAGQQGMVWSEEVEDFAPVGTWLHNREAGLGPGSSIRVTFLESPVEVVDLLVPGPEGEPTSIRDADGLDRTWVKAVVAADEAGLEYLVSVTELTDLDQHLVTTEEPW